MQILHIAGYKFIALHELHSLQELFLKQCHTFLLKGTILLSTEGININLSGEERNIYSFLGFLNRIPFFADMQFHISYSHTYSFKRLKVKIKKEIITFRKGNVDAVSRSAPRISPFMLKEWLDKNRDILLLDVRNAYEVKFGTFTNALHLNLADFSEFPNAIKTINEKLPVVMFCTGGIRCEKAALFMQNQGFPEVYQLEGGILEYFKQIGDTHYQGECFVFDERIALNSHLQPKELVND